MLGLMRIRWGAILFAAALPACAPHTTARAAPCDIPGALGTFRAISISPGQHIGAATYRALPLEEKEIVLTFDDGPNPDSTPAILKALKAECVKATFFPIGSAASESPKLLKQVIAEGHSVGGHTGEHENLSQLPADKAIAAIEAGFAPLEAAGVKPSFLRFPELADTPGLLSWADDRGLAVIGVDIDPSDWAGDPPRETLARLKADIVARRRGIILLHDSQANTAALLPDLLSWLKQNGYRISQIVPAASSPTAVALR